MISIDVRFPKLNHQNTKDIVVGLSEEDSILVLKKSSEINTTDVMEYHFGELIEELEGIIGRYMPYEIATGRARWDITKEVIDRYLNSEDEAFAHIIYYAPKTTEDQRVFLRMKWYFL